jgi:hypothetical protein
MEFSRNERLIAAAATALGALAIFGPHVAEPAGYYAFVDARVWHGVPNAGDVLSNLAFLVAGILGLVALRRAVPGLSNMERAMALLFFGGLAATTVCSSWYHLAPDEARLALDRSGMALAFAGLLGFAAASKVSERAAAALALGLLFATPWAVGKAAHGELLPWAVLQFGGMLLLVAMATLRSLPASPQVNWLAVIAIYAMAKGCESADAVLFEATHHLASGHTLKHIVAACAALPVIVALHWHNRPAADRAWRFRIARSPQ